MARLHWFWARLNDRIGLVGWLILLVMSAMSLYGYFVFLPDQQRLQTLKLNPVHTTQPPIHVEKYISPADQFFAAMPAVETITASIQTVFDVAEQQGLTINEVIYKDKIKQGQTALRYDMTFSIVASYPDIKAFIVNVLAKLPWLSLEQLTFERDELDSDSVVTHLRFTFYVVK